MVGVTLPSSLGLAGGEQQANLIPNPEFLGAVDGKALPRDWHREVVKVPGLKPSQIFIREVDGAHPGRLLALVGGPDRGGRVWCQVRGIQPDTDYLLEFSAYRPHFTSDVYLEVEIFGQRHVINQHLSSAQLQRIFMHINSGNYRGDARVVFTNPHSEILAFGSPSLRRLGPDLREPEETTPPRLPTYFPVGIYIATLDSLEEIRTAGFNAVIKGDSRPESVRQLAGATARLGLKFMLEVRGYQADVSREIGRHPEILGLYIEDEPEGKSVPPKSLEAVKKRLQQDHPGILTGVAMVRPQMVAEYRKAADVFLMDPYPVPQMPMTWLSDTLEEAARHVSRERLWAVIQAFGGPEHTKEGWPRLPTPLEMRCLTYLALVHGAHGLFYFNYPEVRKGARAWEGLQEIVGQLRQLRTWLVVPNEETSLKLEIFSPFKADASGRPAVHFCSKRRGTENLLILVNVIDRSVSFFLDGLPPDVTYLSEIFGQQKSVVLDGAIREKLGPYEVRVYSYRQSN